MRGAKEYSELFKGNEQHGKLYIKRDSHARGTTLHVWVLPTDEKLQGSIYSCKEAIEVYGITGGQPGWTETYGWLHKGKWKEDFEKIVKSKKLALEAKKAKKKCSTEEAEQKERARVKELLSNY